VAGPGSHWFLALALIWAACEASFFFVIPDVVICFITLRYGLRQGLLAVAASIVGAMLGGVIAYFWGQDDIAGARAYFNLLPAISSATIERAGGEIIATEPTFLLLKGAFTSVPYKLYASEAGAAGLSLERLMAMTPIIRLPRFLIAALVTAMIAQFTPQGIRNHKYKLMAGFWVVFYAAYWSLAPS
jgi:membrane protein YqaA with SNARE-associated domain